MIENSPSVDVWIDAKLYRQFSIFDAIRKERKWIRPLIFAIVFCALAIVCFLFKQRVSQGALLGIVLLVIGIGLPLVYFGSYFMSLHTRIQKLKIGKEKRHAYCITLTNSEILATSPNGKEQRFAWKDVWNAYRFPNVIYLYVQAGKAYLLPKEQAGDQYEALWAQIEKMLPSEKRHLHS
ncbi:MAG: YcxB family protein [Eubacteriales bacterium]|nr:YcxB family protein [Eubacteriales bacterium]